MGKLGKFVALITKLETKFGLDQHKLHLLGIADEYWDTGRAARVTDLLNAYEGTSRATTHKAIKELVDAGMFTLIDSRDDKRVKFVAPGKKITQLEKLL